MAVERVLPPPAGRTPGGERGDPAAGERRRVSLLADHKCVEGEGSFAQRRILPGKGVKGTHPRWTGIGRNRIGEACGAFPRFAGGLERKGPVESTSIKTGTSGEGKPRPVEAEKTDGITLILREGVGTDREGRLHQASLGRNGHLVWIHPDYGAIGLGEGRVDGQADCRHGEGCPPEQDT